MSHCRVCNSAVLVGFSFWLAGFGVDVSAALRNVAPEAAYSFNPKPNYPQTTDAFDGSQLHDGKTIAHTMWLSNQAVGWQLSDKAIDIDFYLSASSAIRKVCLTTAENPKAGVYLPKTIHLFGSAEGVNFAWAGEFAIVQADGNAGVYRRVQYCLGGLDMMARHLVLQIEPRGSYFFTDEVQIWSENTLLNTARKGAPNADIDRRQLRRFSVEHTAVGAELAANRDWPLIEAPGAAAKATLEVLERHWAGGHGLQFGFAELALIRRALAAWRGQRIRAAGHVLIVERTDPWARLPVFTLPPKIAVPAAIHVVAGFRAHLSLSIAHSGTTGTAIGLRARAHGGGSEGLVVKLYEAALVHTAAGKQVADPLVPLADSQLVVEEGEVRQVLITVDTSSVAVGLQTVDVDVEAFIGNSLQVSKHRFEVHVWPRPTLKQVPSTTVWGYLTDRTIAKFPSIAAADMLSHGVTTAVLPAATVPWPRPSASFGSARPTFGDYAIHDAELTSLVGFGEYAFFMSLNNGSPRRGLGAQHSFLSEGWQVLYRAWLTEWAARFERLGHRRQALLLYPMDEPTADQDLVDFVRLSRISKEAIPGLRMVVTLHEPKSLTPQVIDAADVIYLNGAAIDARAIDQLRAAGKDVRIYFTLGGGKGGEPAGFYRKQAWDALALDVDGFGFWSYSDAGRSGIAWDDLDGERPDYAVIYEAEDGIRSSKRWEAWAAGVQDFFIARAASEKAEDTQEMLKVRALIDEGRQAHNDDGALMVIRLQLLKTACPGYHVRSSTARTPFSEVCH